MKDFHFNFLSIAAAATLIALVGIFLWQRTVVQEQLDEKDQEIATLEAQLQESVRNDLKTSNDKVIQDNNPQSELDLAIVTFQPGGLFSAELKNELQKKLIDPYLDFYNEDGIYVVTMNIAAPEQGAISWSVFATNADGSYSDFLFGDKNQTIQRWWLPDCLGDCNFSNTFKGKYPEIVSEVES